MSAPLSRVCFYLSRFLCSARPTRLGGSGSAPLLPQPLQARSGSPKSEGGAATSVAASAESALRWRHRVLCDDLIDVGFGMPPLPTPLLSAQLALRLGRLC